MVTVGCGRTVGRTVVLGRKIGVRAPGPVGGGIVGHHPRSGTVGHDVGPGIVGRRPVGRSGSGIVDGLESLGQLATVFFDLSQLVAGQLVMVLDLGQLVETGP